MNIPEGLLPSLLGNTVAQLRDLNHETQMDSHKGMLPPSGPANGRVGNFCLSSSVARVTLSVAPESAKNSRFVRFSTIDIVLH